MSNSLLLLWLTLREIKCYQLKPNHQGTEIWQRVIFLLQESNLPFGYHFIWYVYGPYSDMLGNEIRHCDSYGENFVYQGKCLSEWRLSNDLKKKILRTMNQLRPKMQSICLEDQLRAAAYALAFVSWDEMSAAEALAELKKRKPLWPADYNRLSNFLGFFPPKPKVAAA